MMNSENKSIVAIIPVREGSRRLKNKNILPFGNSTLLQHKIEQLKKVPEISRIVVSSDSEIMLKMAQESGVDIHKRTLEYSDDVTKPFGAVVSYICSSQIEKHVLWATCTSPLLTPELYSSAIQLYARLDNEKFDSLVGVELLKRYLWNAETPINYELGLKHVTSQNLPDIYALTNGVFLAPRENMITWNYFHGISPYKFVLPKVNCVDIDDELDLEVAKAWLKYI